MNKLDKYLANAMKTLMEEGRAKGKELIITDVIPASGDRGPRYRIQGYDRNFIKMNSNSYLGLSMHPELVKAEESAVRRFGVGPGAVRFISGSYLEHIELERALADFHGREAAMIFSSAYVTSLGVISSLITPDTAVISDALNHNCIINALRMSRPAVKLVYQHNDMDDLRQKITGIGSQVKRCLIITDGIFSMRGDHAPLDAIAEIREAQSPLFEEGITLIVDDSHGVGACGTSGRGTEELTGAKADILIATLGKAFGVNGGYVTGSHELIAFLRETAPTYIYSNPITVSEAAAARMSIKILNSSEGKKRLSYLKDLTNRFRLGLEKIGMETIPGEHPVVPLMIRNTLETAELVSFLRDHGVLATGLNFPVVPKGEEEIRFQICADHTCADIDEVLEIINHYRMMRKK